MMWIDGVTAASSGTWGRRHIATFLPSPLAAPSLCMGVSKVSSDGKESGMLCGRRPQLTRQAPDGRLGGRSVSRETMARSFLFKPWECGSQAPGRGLISQGQSESGAPLRNVAKVHWCQQNSVSRASWHPGEFLLPASDSGSEDGPRAFQRTWIMSWAPMGRRMNGTPAIRFTADGN